MSAAVCLMHANIKFDGALILQVFGDGPVKLAVAEARTDLGFRATAKVVGPVPASAQLEAMLNLHGQGRCAITLDPNERIPARQPYQGVVPLHGDRREPLQRLSQVLEHYMLQSEQLDTLVLAAMTNAAGLLIQRLPAQGDANLSGSGWKEGDEDGIGRSEDFNRIALLAATLTGEELLTLQPEQILKRLFWQETVRLFEPLQPRFACTCSRQRVAGMLRGLGRDEVDSLLAEQGQAEVARDLWCDVPLRCSRCRRGVRGGAQTAAGAALGQLRLPGLRWRSQSGCRTSAHGASALLGHVATRNHRPLGVDQSLRAGAGHDAVVHSAS
jgi:molecular chaperone Hsp33